MQAVIDRGSKAKDALEHPAVLAVIDDLTNYHLSALIAAPPGERGKEARDYHHLLQHALTELVGQLRSYAEAGEAALTAVRDGSTEDDFS